MASLEEAHPEASTSRRAGLLRQRMWIVGAMVLIGLSVTTPSCRDGAGSSAPATASGLEASRRPGNPASEATVSAKEPAVLAEAKFFRHPPALNDKDAGRVAAGSQSCLACHHAHDTLSMHEREQAISCRDCHGGQADSAVPPNVALLPRTSSEFIRTRDAAHVSPAVPELWKTSANPATSGARTLDETADYIRFVNPGDLRVAMVSCGECHREQVEKVRKSMMAHGAMLWGAALYNNGAINRKTPVFGETYSVDGKPARVTQEPLPTPTQFDRNGILTQLWPLPRWEVSQPGNILRVFERGGKGRPQIGVPGEKEDPGRPDVKLSARDFGTDVRTDPVFLGLQKTRLLDPTLNLLGTNDHPGDYRASGCSACHVVYANDRSPVHSGQMFSKYGNRGESFSIDPTVNTAVPTNAIPTTAPTNEATAGYSKPWDETRKSREAGHPIKHVMVRNMPTSTCISCHIHPGTNVVNAYLGFMWWDNETDGRSMYPRNQQYPDAELAAKVSRKNPEGSAARGLWSNEYPSEVAHDGRVAGPEFLEKLGTPEFNERLTRTQFADFHGHGWVFRAVFKQDRHGNLLDYNGDKVPPHNPAEPKKFNTAMASGVGFQSPKNGDHPPAGVPVHLKDIHLERGMHCVDCHFDADSHGNGNLYGQTRDAVHVSCEDCHGTSTEPAKIYRALRIREGIDTEKTPGETDLLLAGALTGNAVRSRPPAEARETASKLLSGKSTRFRIRPEDSRFVQVSALDSNVVWAVPQTVDTIDPSSWWSQARKEPVRAQAAGSTPASVTSPTTVAASPATVDHATLARYAHSIRKDGKTWGSAPTDADIKNGNGLAHSNSRMSCFSCHSSWNTSCFGCHLPMQANQKTPMLHNEGQTTRNFTNYNYQTLRDDVYMLGVDSTSKDNKIVPIRSACAVLVSSQDANRQWIYSQQQTVSAEGYAGTAFSPYFPHTVRATETKQCSDCHVSKKNDNNAVLAQLMLQGTNSVNFIGRYAWVGMGDGGLEGIVVTERSEPQAVIGSTLHELAYSDDYRKHAARNGKLTEGHEHHGTVLDLQMRGEYVYAACGPDGFIAYDIANIDNKGFSERIVTAPVSPLGQLLRVKTSYATSVCSPSTLAIDPTRPRLESVQKLSDGTTRTVRPNEEGKITAIGDPGKVVDPNRGIHPLYAFLYVTDRDEGLVVIGNTTDGPNRPGVATLLDGNPENNFIGRAATFNPGGILKGAKHLALHGTLAYVSCDAGLVVVDLNDPVHPAIVPGVSLSELNQPRKIAFQFRYGFVCDEDGLKVIDVTDPRKPAVVKRNGRAVVVPLKDARDVYVSRTYGYVAAGREGLAIVDLERPEEPRQLRYPADIRLDYNAAADLTDTTAVRIGMTNASLFAYVADGRNGLKVLQLTSPEWMPTSGGFSPKPEPRLVARYETHEPAIAISEGLDRDRAVDEAGNQLSVFGRKGARPFTLEEMQTLYLPRSGDRSMPYVVSDIPETEAITNKPATMPAEVLPLPAEPPVKKKRPFGPK